MSFISKLKKHLSNKEDFSDLSKNIEFVDFDIIGFRETTLFIEFAAFVSADRLTEMQIVAFRNKFFELTRMLPHSFNLMPKGRNPNGLLVFVFEEGCSEKIAKFIQKQSKIAHWMQSGVIVSWAIDVKSKKIYTHKNPVSSFPPVIIWNKTVYPGLEYLQSFLNEY